MLDVRVRSSDSEYRGFVEVVDTSTHKTYLHKPLRGEQFESVLALSNDQIVLLGERANLVIFNGRTGERIASRSISEFFRAGSLVKDLVHLKHHGYIALLAEHRLLLLNEIDLSHVFATDCATWNGATGRLVRTRELSPDLKMQLGSPGTSLRRLSFSGFVRERNSEKIITGYCEEGDGKQGSTSDTGKRLNFIGVYEIDVRAQTILKKEIDSFYANPIRPVFFAASPNGKWGLRRNLRYMKHHKSVPLAGFQQKVFGRKKGYRHPDLRDDGCDRFLYSFELWDLENASFVRNLDVSWIAIENKQDVNDRIRVGDMIDNLEKPFYQIDKGLSQPPKATFTHYFDDLHEKFRKRYWDWQSAWENTNEAFWMTHSDGFRRIGMDGTVSPILRIGSKVSRAQSAEATRELWRHTLADVTATDEEFVIRNEYCMLRLPRSSVFQNSNEVWISEQDAQVVVLCENAGLDLKARDLLHLSGHIVELMEWSELGAKQALTNLKQELRSRFSDMLGGGQYNHTFELAFRYQEKLYSEADFFDRVTRENWNLLSETRALLETWLDKFEERDLNSECYTSVCGGVDPESGYPTGGLAQALKHLVLKEQASLDVFRKYLARRDGEHEVFSSDILVRSYLEKYGFTSREAFKFGIFWVAIRYRDGRGPVENLWNELGLLDVASKSLLPSTFADLVFEEFNSFNVKWSWNDQSIGEVLEALEKILPGNGNWAKQLSDQISARSFDGSRREYQSPLRTN
ncbi:hypothetical protein K1718_20715 [Roseibium porphyridii]|uniref:Uncharacterized protein n=1 Tax=Roseibium porphyridii TaxID=2866279 RepID=A0ABY8EZI2_9HYPH|nr:hypothetical protein [Roseibium sp. KMA01]WFE88567.1 hypothetical protein K1718_20715 [Roseibium sp. KMA01]